MNLYVHESQSKSGKVGLGIDYLLEFIASLLNNLEYNIDCLN